MSAITDEHIAFARAVVDLARQHKMDGIRLEFGPSFSHPTLTDYIARTRVTMSWSEGRHGDASNISLECRAAMAIEEKP